MTGKKIIAGKWLSCHHNDQNFCEIIFDAKKGSVNKFNQATLDELRECINKIKSENTCKGLLFTSAKDSFIVGADITEFTSLFTHSEDQLKKWLLQTQQLFCDIEDLNIPTVMAINGICLGGGMELALSACFRVGSNKAVMGLPETKLGIYPGWGGTIRLPKILGVDEAIEWIAGGKHYKSDAALKSGALDAVVEPKLLHKSATELLCQCIEGKIDWKQKQTEKKSPIPLVSPMESAMAFGTAKAFIAQKAGPNYPAPLEALSSMEKSVALTRDEAIEIEVKGFIKVAKTLTAKNLIGLFLSDQFNKKKNKSQSSKKIDKAAVVGAGIMGGGIAYQSASRKASVLMKDINHPALELGLKEAAELLNKQHKRKKINSATMLATMSKITPTLSYDDFKYTQIVVEAVVENQKVKEQVLLDIENAVEPTTVITSNTSTISIDKLASGLKRPENFCGMHFFNPVHRMPLVEVIRGKKTSKETIAQVVSYTLQLGKTPIVVNDCPGFLVNRVLFPYLNSLSTLLRDGVEFTRIDKVMEKFGWPMGPAYLIDVIGIDTSFHAAQVMAQSFPDRMKDDKPSIIEALFKEKRLGQKNLKGFYNYNKDKKGKLKKSLDPTISELLKNFAEKSVQTSDQEIVDRMMIPMITESITCLEEKIVETPMELDLGVIYGLGFPPFRGGILRYAETIGIKEICQRAQKHLSYGNSYQPTKLMLQMAQENKNFYPTTN